MTPPRVTLAAATLLAAVTATLRAQSPADGQPRNAITRQQVRLAIGDSGNHFVAEQETSWRIATQDTLVLLVDSTLRVVRLALDGRRTTSWGRTGTKLVIPHTRSPGDTLVTRVRFHGAPSGQNWFALPRDVPDSAPLVLIVEVPDGRRPVTSAAAEQVDTLAYGRTSWRFRFAAPVALRTLRLTIRCRLVWLKRKIEEGGVSLITPRLRTQFYT
jgi:hypothetical protein